MPGRYAAAVGRKFPVSWSSSDGTLDGVGGRHRLPQGPRPGAGGERLLAAGAHHERPPSESGGPLACPRAAWTEFISGDYRAFPRQP